MKQELNALLLKERKWKRELAELRAIRQKLGAQVAPDPRMLKMVDEEIANLLK